MTQVDLQRLTVGLSPAWAGFLRDWDRSLRSANHPATTRYNYLLAAAQLARHLGEFSPDPDGSGTSGSVASARQAAKRRCVSGWSPYRSRPPLAYEGPVRKPIAVTPRICACQRAEDVFLVGRRGIAYLAQRAQQPGRVHRSRLPG